MSLDDLKFDELVPSKSKYLAKSDVGDDGVILTIRGFKEEVIEGDDGDEKKIVMYFREADFKPMILNRTNAALLAGATGVGTAGESKGKQIVVHNDPSISFGGKVTGGLRIKKIPGPARAPRQVEQREPGSDDDIDFG
jgi:hypothetical protein